MPEIDIDRDTAGKLGTEIVEYVNKYGTKHPELKTGDVMMALMQAMMFAVATITSRAGRENAAMDVKRILPDMIDRALARAAEIEAEGGDVAEPAALH